MGNSQQDFLPAVGARQFVGHVFGAVVHMGREGKQKLVGLKIVTTPYFVVRLIGWDA